MQKLISATIRRLTAARVCPPSARERPTPRAAVEQLVMLRAVSRAGSRPVQALPELLDELAVEPVVPAQRDLAGQPALARPTRHRVRRHASSFETSDRVRTRFRRLENRPSPVCLRPEDIWPLWLEQIDQMIQADRRVSGRQIQPTD